MNQKEDAMIKTEIINVLRQYGALTLTEIQQKIRTAATKQAVSHHLNKMFESGQIQKNEKKKYKIPDVCGFDAEEIKTIFLPCITAKAGPNDNVVKESISKIKITPRQTYKPTDLVVVKVSGTSMVPTFDDGDLLLFRKTLDRPQNNKVVLWRVDDGVKIKRIKWMLEEDGTPYCLLLSDNVQDENNKPIKVTDVNSNYIGTFVSIINKKY